MATLPPNGAELGLNPLMMQLVGSPKALMKVSVEKTVARAKADVKNGTRDWSRTFIITSYPEALLSSGKSVASMKIGTVQSMTFVADLYFFIKNPYFYGWTAFVPPVRVK
jgi:hypothetical protein